MEESSLRGERSLEGEKSEKKADSEGVFHLRKNEFLRRRRLVLERFSLPERRGEFS